MMPQILENTSAKACSLEECVDALADIGFNPSDPASVDRAAEWLDRLSKNRTFLADHLIDRLSGGSQGAVESGYGPQAILLSPLHDHRDGGFFLRANIWPAEHDLCFKNSGAETFVYGVAHDHNFSFLTSGYLGPGYSSDYFEYEYGHVAGYAGEPVDLRFVERSVLHEGKLMLYRAHRDVHSQLPATSLSVSLNIMHVDPAQCWFDQYGFDLERREVGRVLSPNATEAFLRVAVATGAEEALEYADWVGRCHPSDRLRLASFEARAGRVADPASEDDLWRSAENSGSLMVEEVAKSRRIALSASK